MSIIGTSHLYAKTTLETGERYMRVGQYCANCISPYDLLEFLNINNVDNNGHFTGSITFRDTSCTTITGEPPCAPPIPIIGDYNSTSDAISFTAQRMQPPDKFPPDLYQGYLMNTTHIHESAMGGKALLMNEGTQGWMAWPACNLC